MEEEQDFEGAQCHGGSHDQRVQRALWLVKPSRPVLGTVLNKAGQMATTPASMRKLFTH